MNLLFWGLTISVIGKVLLAIGVLWAHRELAIEGKIDKEVIRSFTLERWLTIIGLLLIVLGYAMEIYFYGFTPFLTCEGFDCMSAVSGSISQ
ncbi:MAG: hypothetical protein AAGA35_00320 [Patescibacteria group bacterium]